MSRAVEAAPADRIERFAWRCRWGILLWILFVWGFALERLLRFFAGSRFAPEFVRGWFGA